MTSSITQVAYALDLALWAFSFGGTAWFFFVQSPMLLKWMGKERFLPIQMKMASVLFKALALSVPLMFATTLIHGQEDFWLHAVTSGVAMLGALTNAFIVGPRALRAGGSSLRDVRSGEEKDQSVGGFVSVGGGQASKVWHRLVVVFVLMMMGGLVAHAVVLVG